MISGRNALKLCGVSEEAILQIEACYTDVPELNEYKEVILLSLYESFLEGRAYGLQECKGWTPQEKKQALTLVDKETLE